MKGSKKRRPLVVSALIISMLAITFFDISISAHERYTKSKNGKKEIGHDNQLELILFGEDYGSKNSQSRPESVKTIEDAAYLCIDLFNNGSNSAGETEIGNLVKQGVYLPLIAPSISSFNYSDTAHHRIHTHEGWNYQYPDSVTTTSGDESDWQAIWKTRKNILKDTVRHELGYTPLVSDINGSADKIDHLAQMIYYIHLLGDIEDTASLKAYRNNPVMLLAYNHATASEDEYPDIICEFKKCCQIVFSDSEGTAKYNQLMNDLDSYHKKAQAYTNSPASYSYVFYNEQVVVYGTIPDSHRFEQYQAVTSKFIEEVLMDNIPDLLKEATFYQDSTLYNDVCNS